MQSLVAEGNGVVSAVWHLQRTKLNPIFRGFDPMICILASSQLNYAPWGKTLCLQWALYKAAMCLPTYYRRPIVYIQYTHIASIDIWSTALLWCCKAMILATSYFVIFWGALKKLFGSTKHIFGRTLFEWQWPFLFWWGKRKIFIGRKKLMNLLQSKQQKFIQR